MNEINFKDEDEKDTKRPDPLGEKLMKSRVIMVTDEITKKLAQNYIQGKIFKNNKKNSCSRLWD